MKYSINTPEGTRDRLFAECRDRRSAQDALTGLFRRRGYAEVSTPEVEFYDLFLQSGNPMPQEAMLKIILVFAELERNMTNERVMATMIARATDKQWNGGCVNGWLLPVCLYLWEQAAPQRLP